MKFNVTGTGTRPLLMHSDRSVNPFDELQQAKKRLTDKKTKKTEDDIRQIARYDWEMGMYFEPVVGPVLPVINLQASLQKAAGLTRNGKDVERGVQIVGDLNTPLLYRGPRELEDLWGGGIGASEYVDYRTVGQGQVRVMRCRPIFRQWGFEIEVDINPTLIDPDSFVEFFKRAGDLIGVGDYRKVYGRFDVEITEI